MPGPRLLLVLVLSLALLRPATACIGSGCVHDRERNQFFWCSGKADEEVNVIKSVYGGLTESGFIQYCTGISAMVVTTDLALRSVAEKHCGTGHRVICHEDISGRSGVYLFH